MGWEFGVAQPWQGKGARLKEDQRSYGIWSSGSTSLWGRAFCAALAILLVYGGMERSSMSWGFRVLMFQISLVLNLCQAVSSFLSKSLDHGGQKVCGYVPITILDLPHTTGFKSTDKSQHNNNGRLYYPILTYR
jgi:hypothetical protein